MRKKPLLIKIRLEKVIVLVKCWSKKKKKREGLLVIERKKKKIGYGRGGP